MKNVLYILYSYNKTKIMMYTCYHITLNIVEMLLNKMTQIFSSLTFRQMSNIMRKIFYLTLFYKFNQPVLCLYVGSIYVMHSTKKNSHVCLSICKMSFMEIASKSVSEKGNSYKKNFMKCWNIPSYKIKIYSLFKSKILYIIHNFYLSIFNKKIKLCRQFSFL